MKEELLKLDKMNTLIEEEKGEVSENRVIMVQNKKIKLFSEFEPYFKKSKSENIVLFRNKKNLNFIKDFEGFFNLLDLNGNRILTKCKLDIPLCSTNLEPKGNIFGRDKVVYGRFNFSKGKFEVLESPKYRRKQREIAEKLRQEKKF